MSKSIQIGLSDQDRALQQDRAFEELLLPNRKTAKTSQKCKVLSENVRPDKMNGPLVSKIYGEKTA